MTLQAILASCLINVLKRLLPTNKDDQQNHYARDIIATTRKLENEELKGKSGFNLQTGIAKKGLPRRKQELLVIREEWKRLVNQSLARSGKKEKISHKKLETKGIKQPPTIHLGSAVTAMEHKGIKTE